MYLLYSKCRRLLRRHEGIFFPFLCLGLMLAGCREVNLPAVNRRGEVAVALAADGSWQINPDNPADIYITDFNGSFLRRASKTNLCHAWISWSPDGKKLIYTEFPCAESPRSATLKLMNERGEKRVLAQTESELLWPQWSPGGKDVLYGHERNLHIVSLDSGKDRQITHFKPDGTPIWYSWARDGKSVFGVKTASLSRSFSWPHEVFPGTLFRINVAVTTKETLLIGVFHAWNFPVPSRDGKSVYFSALDMPSALKRTERKRASSLLRMNPEHRSIEVVAHEQQSIMMPLIQPDGRNIFYAHALENGSAIVEVPATGGPKKFVVSSSRGLLPFWVSGKQLFYVEGDEREHSLWLLSLADKSRVNFTKKLKELFAARKP